MKSHHTLIFLATAISLPTLAASKQLTSEQNLQEGALCLRERNATAALVFFHKAIQSDPENIRALRYMAITHYYMGQYDEAYEQFKKCWLLNPDHNPTTYSLAITLDRLGEFEEAQSLLETLHKNDPTHEGVQELLASGYIRSMDWDHARPFCKTKDVWWEDKDMANQSILLDISETENRLGDAILITRYAKQLHDAGAQVTVRASQVFGPLFRLCPYIDHVTDKRDVVPPFDIYSTLTKNSFILHAYNNADACATPYLYTDEALLKQCKQQLWYDPQIKIGICWQGTMVKDYLTQTMIHDKQILRPQDLIPLFEIGPISLYSLTKGNQQAVDELRKQNHVIYSVDMPGTEIPFVTTAAVMKNMDLIITVDNYIAHLAGAMGLPVWLLLQKSADCCWFADQNNSVWYPSMRIFRQETQGEWAPVIQELKTALEEFLKTKKSYCPHCSLPLN